MAFKAEDLCKTLKIKKTAEYYKIIVLSFLIAFKSKSLIFCHPTFTISSLNSSLAGEVQEMVYLQFEGAQLLHVCSVLSMFLFAFLFQLTVGKLLVAL